MKKGVEDINGSIILEIEKQLPGFSKLIHSYNVITVPKDRAWSIYSIRYKIISEEGALHKTSGFKQTLDNLQKSQLTEILIHALYNSTELLLVFTDKNCEIIIGMILYSS